MENSIKNTMFRIYMEKFGFNNDAVIAYAAENSINDYEKLLKEFSVVENKVIDNMWEISKPNKQLTPEEIRSATFLFCSDNFSWLDEESSSSLNSRVMYISWHEGILKKDS